MDLIMDLIKEVYKGGTKRHELQFVTSPNEIAERRSKNLANLSYMGPVSRLFGNLEIESKNK